MKKYFAVVLLLIFLLSFAGCRNGQDSNNISEYLTEQDGKQYLILPVSKNMVKIWNEQTQYLNNIDIDLLKEAEKKISEEASKYSDDFGFFLQVDDGHLYLCAEVIINIDPLVSAEHGEAGCGIDHEHKFFSERITK